MKNILTALIVILTIAFSGAATAKTQEMYFLYGDPKPGTKFKEKLFSANVPFDKSYKQMSPELQARVKASYGGLADSETPPYPTEGVESIYRGLEKSLRELKTEGKLLAIAMVDKGGKLKSVQIYQSPDDRMSKMLNYILFNTEFDAATCDGKPCEMEYLFEAELEVSPSWTR